VLSAINTDLTPRDAINLMTFANALPNERIKLFMAPGKASYIGDISYWILDIAKLTPLLVANPEEGGGNEGFSNEVVDAMPPDLNPETLLDLVGQIGKIGILNGDGANGLGRRASQVFQKLGVDVVYTGNARHFDYYTSNIVYPENASENDRQAAEALARLCGITNKSLIQKNRTASMVSVILGHDKESIFQRLEGVRF
jgi:hypothetical protein